MISNLLNVYYLKKKMYHLLTIKLDIMENNKNKNRQEVETGSQDQYDHHVKTDNRQRDTLNEHQNSTRVANPQVQNASKNSEMNYSKGQNNKI
jgi:hypothetical protein